LKIYTKTGDNGETSLFGGKRVPKDSMRIEAYGSVDELNSIIGVCRSINNVKEIDAILEEIQSDLFTLGADLATPFDNNLKDVKRIDKSFINRLERHIDKLDPQLKPLKQFILPGGDRTAAEIHLARTVCRRAERKVVHLSHTDSIGENIIIYLNRLSDLLFVLARWSNVQSNTIESMWQH
jgi:cob(I)alamin adenosyltransferase